MERLVAALLASLFLIGLVPAGAQEMYVAGGTIQWATGIWITNKNGVPHGFYMADATRSVDPALGEVGVYLLVAKGRCQHFERKRFSVTICSAGGRVYRGDLDDFEFDPALRSAAMQLRSKGYTHKAGWTGEDSGSPSYGGELIDQRGARGASGGIDQITWAESTGRLFDRRLTRKQLEFGLLYQGAGATAVVFTDEAGRRYEVERTVRGSWMDVTLRIRS